METIEWMAMHPWLVVLVIVCLGMMVASMLAPRR